MKLRFFELQEELPRLTQFFSRPEMIRAGITVEHRLAAAAQERLLSQTAATIIVTIRCALTALAGWFASRYFAT